MGRILERNDSFAPGSYHGCIAGLLNILDYHHWHVKRLLPHKRHHGRRSGRLNRSPNISSHLREELNDVDAEPLLDKQYRSEEKTPTSKRSRKAHSTFSNDEHRGSWIVRSYLNSWLHRTSPIHRLSPSRSWDYPDANDEIPVLVSQKNGSIHARNKSENDQLAMSKDFTDQQLGECVDVLEIFKANKEIFLKILQDPEACKKQFHGLKNSNIKLRLAKSRSFPVASSNQASYIRPSTLKHKQNEVWFFTDGENPAAGTRVRDSESDTDSVRADDGRKGTGKPTSQGWNQVVIRRFRDIKRKIKHALKDSRSEKNGHKSVEECPTNETEISERLEITIDGERNDLENRRLERIRRTSSLNESLDRYTRLFENTSGGNTKKFSHSMSLRLSKSNEKPSQKSCRRNLSLSDLDSLSSFLSSAVARDATHLEMPFNTDNQITKPESILLETEFYTDMDDSDSDSEIENRTNQTVETAASQGISSLEEEISQPNQESDSESCSPVFPLTKGSESETHCTQPQNEDFNYVRHVLELSTSMEEPLNPSIFKRIEESLDRDDEDETERHYRQLSRQALFDLVNEALVDLGEKSLTYFPRPSKGPKPMGSGLLEELWRRVEWYLGLRPEMDTSLDDVVGRDLAKGEGWRHVDWEREMVALELEDLLFDHLLDELLFA